MSIFRGASDFFRGVGFLASRPRLWGWVIAPAICALVVLIALACAVGALIDPAVIAVSHLLPAAIADGAASALRIVIIVLLALGALSIYVAVVALVTAPFSECLSEAIEVMVSGTPGETFSPVRFVADGVRGAGHSARRIAVYLVKMAILFCISLIPVVGPIAYIAGGAWITAQFAGYDCYDAVWARKRLRYREKATAMRTDRGRIVGLGAVVGLLLTLPVINLFVLPVGAAGATLASLDSPRSRP